METRTRRVEKIDTWPMNWKGTFDEGPGCGCCGQWRVAVTKLTSVSLLP